MAEKFFFTVLVLVERRHNKKKSRFLAEYKRTHLWKLCFVRQRKEKTKVETSDNSKKLLPAIPLDFTNEPLDPDVTLTYEEGSMYVF